MKLFYRELGEGNPIIILHGLFGSSDNWLSIAKILSESFKVYSIDQRNHGQSPHNEEFNYSVMAEDLKDFIETNNIKNPIIMGHSMGGKTAMEFAVNNPDSWSKLIVVDIAPKAYPVHHDKILEGLKSLDLKTLSSRGEADRQLSEYVPQLGVRQFLLKNLARGMDGFEWKINLTVIANNIEKMGEGLSKTLRIEKPVLFINGQNSDYITPQDKGLLEKAFPSSELVTIPDAGHWVHSEQPDVFLNTIRNFINQ